MVLEAPEALGVRETLEMQERQQQVWVKLFPVVTQVMVVMVEAAAQGGMLPTAALRE
jgi:hypothetical protein